MRRTVFTSPILLPPLRLASRALLKLGGWTLYGEGEREGVDKYVLVAGPHTSNWDLLWLLVAAFVLRIRVFWMGKHTIFRQPARALMLWLGGVPIDRRQSHDVVAQMSDAFAGEEVLHLLIPPEGSRARRAKWKTGFWHIAMQANVPVYLSFLCYKTRRVGIGPRIDLTGDINADMRRIIGFYVPMVGKYPDQGPQLEDMKIDYAQAEAAKTGTDD